MPSTNCKDHIKDYCSNCTFAGVHFIADDTKHWSERLLWVGLVVLSWYGSTLLIIAAWDSFVLNPISFGVETTYTDWDTKMPSVSICETSNDKQIYNVSDTVWTPNHLLDLEDALRDIAYYRGISYNLVKQCYMKPKPDINCPMSNYSYLANLVRSDCSDIIANCTYNGKSFECCKYFQLLPTDLGKCYTINSIQTRNTDRYPMISNRTNKRGILGFEVLMPSMMYTLGEDEVPTVTTLQSSTLRVQLGQIYHRHLAVRNIENDPLVEHTSSEQRSCYFHDENKDGLYPKYSYSACTVRCRRKAQREVCDCNDHFMLNTTEDDHCNITGMYCLHKHTSQLTTLKPSWSTRPGLVCDCLPSCDESEVTVIKDVQISNRKNRKKAMVYVILAYLPTERFKRSVVRSRLDLVVSVGGTTGLFVGASLLSFVELLFFFTIRYASNLWMERGKLHRAGLRNGIRFAETEAIVYSINTVQTPYLYSNYQL